jgi:hypothetical protein
MLARGISHKAQNRHRAMKSSASLPHSTIVDGIANVAHAQGTRGLGVKT